MQNLAQQYDPQPYLHLQPESTLVVALVQHLASLGVRHAFGVSGGAIALLFDALAESEINLHHFRHESGAAFAATEAFFASGRPSVVFATTGPGTLNALTGITAAKWEGAKVILISGATSPAQRGRWATQETSSYTLPQDALYTAGPLFDFAVRMEHACEFPEVARRLAAGLARPGGFVAHVCLPMGLQAARLEAFRQARTTAAAPTVSSEDIAQCAQLLQEGAFALWVGFGARHAAEQVRTLAERAAAKVFCSPRGKGIMPEDHPLFLGVTGLGGHDAVIEYMVQERPQRVLVLGTRLGEATSFWDADMAPAEGFIHVDLDPEVPGTAYPEVATVAIQAEIGHFLGSLLTYFPDQGGSSKVVRLPKSRRELAIPLRRTEAGLVRPQVLMQAIQRQIVARTDALVLSECGNAFAWCNHYLRFATPHRYRVSTLFGSMGHCTSGVVGAALAQTGRKAVAVVGDGSMLMNSEVSTAVQYSAPAVWIVLNDSGYGMCRDGHRALGLCPAHTDFPCVDFVGLARSMGADGCRVEREPDLAAALDRAMASRHPFVLDIRIDPDEPSPLLKRFESLIQQGSSKNVAGWDPR